MSWLKLDDLFAENPKVASLSDAAFRFHVKGLLFSARHLTDGLVTAVAARGFATRWKSLSAELVRARLWKPTEGGWVIHDYTEYNPTRESVLAERERRSTAGRIAAGARWSDAKSHANGNANRMADRTGSSDAPGPARPVPGERASLPLSERVTNALRALSGYEPDQRLEAELSDFESSNILEQLLRFEPYAREQPLTAKTQRRRILGWLGDHVEKARVTKAEREFGKLPVVEQERRQREKMKIPDSEN